MAGMLMVRVRYWLQETMESGRWCVTGLMTLESARMVVQSGIHERAKIVRDEPGWPPVEDGEQPWE